MAKFLEFPGKRDPGLGREQTVVRFSDFREVFLLNLGRFAILGQTFAALMAFHN